MTPFRSKRDKPPRVTIAVMATPETEAAGAEHDAQFRLWRLAHEAEDVLLSHEAEQIKECGDPACRWLFLDTSKNHTRRWCNMKTCGNRMKARRFQAKSGQRAVN